MNLLKGNHAKSPYKSTAIPVMQPRGEPTTVSWATTRLQQINVTLEEASARKLPHLWVANLSPVLIPYSDHIYTRTNNLIFNEHYNWYLQIFESIILTRLRNTKPKKQEK